MLRTRVDLPEPDTPVTTVKTLRGKSTSMPLRLFSRAPLMVILRFHFLREVGSSMRSRPRR